ncbi:MAG: hypothetical protein ACOVNY_12115 [Chitinophagaceae bacterium]
MKNKIVQPFLGLLAFFTFSILATSCSKEASTGGTGVVVTAKVAEFKNGDEFIKFSYNTDGSVQKVTLKSDLNTNGSTVEYNVLYNASKKMSELSSVSGEKIVPVYSNNNVLEKADIFTGSVKIGTILYEYQNNLLSKATITTKTGALFIPILEFRFQYSGDGNVTKISSFVPDFFNNNQMVSSGYVEFTYDNKPNPLHSQKEVLSLLLQPSSKNNVATERHYDENGTLEDVVTYTYTYNTSGLPTSAVVKSGLPNQPVTTTNLLIIYK